MFDSDIKPYRSDIIVKISLAKAAGVCYTEANDTKARISVMTTAEKAKLSPFSLDQYHLSFTGRSFDATVFWARVVSSENESLLTRYTKHTFFEIQYALEGRLVITVGDRQRFTLDESDFIVIPPDTYHQIVDGDDTGARFIMAFSLTAKDDRTADRVLSATAHPYRESPTLRTLLALMAEKSRENSPLCAHTLSCLIEAFLLELCDVASPLENAPADQEKKLSENAKRIENVRKHIKTYHGVGVTVSDLSRRFGLSERHLGRLFRSELNVSLRDAINHEKLRYIEELIASTPLSLGEISALCGFSDEYAMNKFFKRYNKMRLSDYRKTARHQSN